MGTITVNVKNDIEREFRKVVGTVHGTKKGSLGEAITEAMQKWIYEKKELLTWPSHFGCRGTRA